jgi:hypothetical protein
VVYFRQCDGGHVSGNTCSIAYPQEKRKGLVAQADFLWYAAYAINLHKKEVPSTTLLRLRAVHLALLRDRCTVFVSYYNTIGFISQTIQHVFAFSLKTGKTSLQRSGVFLLHFLGE